MRLHPSHLLVTALLTVVASGCGQASAPRPREGAVKRHESRTPAATRAPRQAYDRQKALKGLTALSDLVGRESQTGNLSQADRQGLRAGIAGARRRVGRDLKASGAASPSAVR